MRRLLLIPILLLPLACRENPSPESQAVTTGATTTTATETSSTTASTSTTTIAAPVINGRKLMPVDEATSDPSLVAFRNELLTAVRARNADAVVAMADPKIRTSFGGGGRAADFRRALAQPGVWEDFEQLLAQGGKFVGEGPTRSFWAPYVYSAWPDSQDAFELLAITGENVPLHETRDANSRVLTTLSYDIVGRTGEPGQDKGEWRHVKTVDGQSGWVEARSVRSPIGYRAGFLTIDGKWKLNALVTGD